MPPTKKRGERKGRSATSEVVSGEHAVSIHRHIHGVGFKKRDPRARKETRKFAVKEGDGAPDVRTNTRLSTAIWARGIRNAQDRDQVQLSRKHSADGDSPNRLYTLVTCVPVTTFKKLQTVTVDENSLLIVEQ
ncbi:60S ribosomal protein L31-like [Phyllostomus hastatus]|uniref:60S ribosomal protein L31-like n=1 Tax=Phyllostomus hastatus TaxID=9423 RepID=UPI001E681097|nr:60S ribosomal protein L31-like [Phyllostomus hastatus]